MSADNDIVRYALRIAKLMEEIEYERANLDYDKERMSDATRRIDRLAKAIDEFQYD